MAPKKAVNLANLGALGAKRLAELLLELGAGDAGIKRRLRLELSAEAGAEAVAADIGKRLAAAAQARSFVDGLIARLREGPRPAPPSCRREGGRRPPRLALELLWRFTWRCAEPVLNRVDDSRGDVGDVFPSGLPRPRRGRPRGRTRSGAASPTGLRGRHGQRPRRARSLVEVVLPALKGAGIARLKHGLRPPWRRARGRRAATMRRPAPRSVALAGHRRP